MPATAPSASAQCLSGGHGAHSEGTQPWRVIAQANAAAPGARPSPRYLPAGKALIPRLWIWASASLSPSIHWQCPVRPTPTARGPVVIPPGAWTLTRGLPCRDWLSGLVQAPHLGVSGILGSPGGSVSWGLAEWSEPGSSTDSLAVVPQSAHVRRDGQGTQETWRSRAGPKYLTPCQAPCPGPRLCRQPRLHLVPLHFGCWGEVAQSPSVRPRLPHGLSHATRYSAHLPASGGRESPLQGWCSAGQSRPVGPSTVTHERAASLGTGRLRTCVHC